MQSFLSRLAETLIKEKELSEMAIVFPSRRAGLYFKTALAKEMHHPGLAPKILSIEELMAQISGLIALDNISLAFELYPLYKKDFPDDPFDKYYSWGLLMASDFNEVDSACADGKTLFSNIYDLREIDTSISLWGTESKKPSEAQESFLKFWRMLGKMYEWAIQHLPEQGKAWPGLMAKKSAEKAEAGPLDIPWKKIVFAGFNALSTAEEKLILALIRQGKAECFFDMDSYYTNNPLHEAGLYYRKLKTVFPPAQLKWEGEYWKQPGKKISVTAVPLNVGQAKAAGLIIREWVASGIPAEEIAVVLPDEGLLFPLLNSIPPEVEHFNITMSYPAADAPVSGLLQSICFMYERAKEYEDSGKQYVFYFRDIRKIISHPLLRAACAEECENLLGVINRDNVIFLSPESFEKHNPEGHIFRMIFSRINDTPEVPQKLISFLNILIEKAGAALDDAIQKEVIFVVMQLLQKLRVRLLEVEAGLSFRMFRRLLREGLKQTRVPFTGEPLKGMQIMGMLETRAIDLKNLIVLSVNEGLLPSGKSSSTFIPYNLRKAFGLPAWEEKDAVTAQHFYRLLQRAENISLLYNTETDKRGGGDISRYILQIREEWAATAPEGSWTESILNFPPQHQKPLPITVEKNEEVMNILLNNASGNGFSPSGLHTYLMCPLRFYFRYVARLKEPDDVEESPEANTFGDIVHTALRELYQPFAGREMKSNDFDNLGKLADEIVKRQFIAITGTQQLDTGKNFLLLQVASNLVHRVIVHDKANAPFRLESVEQPYSHIIETDEKKIKISGVFDRVESVNGLTTIVDYKTGNIKSSSINSVDDFREDPIRRRYPFQLAMYAWLYQQPASQEK